MLLFLFILASICASFTLRYQTRKIYPLFAISDDYKFDKARNVYRLRDISAATDETPLYRSAIDSHEQVLEKKGWGFLHFDPSEPMSAWSLPQQQQQDEHQNGGRVTSLCRFPVKGLDPDDYLGSVELSVGDSFDSDSRTIHVVNAETVRELSKKIGKPLSPQRFRPNIVLDRIAPWSEFDWVESGEQISSGSLKLIAISKTVLCEGVSGSDLDDIDIVKELREHFPEHGPYLGVCCKVVSGGTLNVGDCVVTEIAVGIDSALASSSASASASAQKVDEKNVNGRREFMQSLNNGAAAILLSVGAQDADADVSAIDPNIDFKRRQRKLLNPQFNPNRRKLEQPFAVLLLRSAYTSLVGMGVISDAQFQRDFFLIRQNEWEGYKERLNSFVMQGDITSPDYFEFIVFMQYIEVNRALGGLSQAFAKNFQSRVGNYIVEGLNFTVADPMDGDDAVIEKIKLLAAAIQSGGLCGKLSFDDNKQSSRVYITMTNCNNIWSLQNCIQRKYRLRSDFFLFAATAVLAQQSKWSIRTENVVFDTSTITFIVEKN